jgi:hypothetical protein
MRLQTLFGYTAAVLMLIVALATFIGMNYFSHKLVGATGLKISPWFSGGEIVQTIDRGAYKILQHRAVFDGLIGQKTEGFVQIDFAPLAGLPDRINEKIDFDLDGKIDFALEYDVVANTAVITAHNPRVISLAGCHVLKERRAVRVRLRNE